MSPLTLSPQGAESLDDPATDPVLVTRLVEDIARVNHWLGGRHAVRFGLNELLDAEDRGRQLTLFDIGTGAGDLPLDAERWARTRGVTIVPLALDRIAAAARVAHRAGVPVAIGCAGQLPVRDRSVDIVVLSQVAHHLDDPSIVTLFAACSRIARRGVVVSDLMPSAVNGYGLRVAGVLLGLHPTTVVDGITSLARGFTPLRLRRLGAEAGIDGFAVAARPVGRVVAWWRTDR